MENLRFLIKELCKEYKESEWLEFKHNNCTPEMIGQDISALANGAAICEKSYAYMIWGVDDTTHEIVGTDFDLNKAKKGNQELENWLRYLLSKNTDFTFETVDMDGKKVGVLKISRALNQTVTFEKIDYIRVGSYTKKLNEFPNIESELWEKLRNCRFEEEIAK